MVSDLPGKNPTWPMDMLRLQVCSSGRMPAVPQMLGASGRVRQCRPSRWSRAAAPAGAGPWALDDRFQIRRIFDAHAPHLAAGLLRSSLTHGRMGSLRSSAPDHHLGHLAAEYLAKFGINHLTHAHPPERKHHVEPTTDATWTAPGRRLAA